MSTQPMNLTPRKKNSQNHRLKKRIIIVAVAVVVLGGIAWAKFSGGSHSRDADSLYTVKRGNLRISVLESGKIQARKSVSLASEVEGQSTIISIVPEGANVKEGDILVELDSSDLRDRIDQQEITVKSGQAGYTQADEAFEIQKNQNESNIKAAELKVEFAQIDLEKYTEGDWPQTLMKAQNAVVTAETRLQLAKETLDGTIALHKKGYVTDTKLKSDQLSYSSAEIDLNEAKNNEQLLRQYDYKKQLTKLQADYDEAKKELERAKRRAASQEAQAKADRDAKKATFDMQTTRLEKLKDQLQKTVIKAPQPGLVIYASSSGRMMYRGGDRGLIAEGEKVYERQKIIELPDVSVMKVDVDVHESVRDMIKPNQQAIITVEAVPGLTLYGHVDKVAILPNSEQHWMNPDLTVYSTSVIIDDESDALKPGMTAKAEIIIADLPDVLYVPVQAVTVRGEQEVCFRVTGSAEAATPVQVGLSNDNYVEIKSGLKEGEKILLYAPITPTVQTGVKKLQQPETETKPEKPTDTTPSEETPGPPAISEEMMKNIPEEMREKAKAFLENMTPEQRKEMEQKFREMGRTGRPDFQNMTPEQRRNFGPRGTRVPGGIRPGGERPTGPSGTRGERPGRQPSTAPGDGTDAPRETTTPGNQ